MFVEFYALIQPSQKYRQIWCVENELAYRVGVPSPESHPNTYLKLSGGGSLEQQFKSAFPFWDDLLLEKLSLSPGQYFPRIARPIHQHPQDWGRFPTHSMYETEAAQSVGQLDSLVFRLKEIFRIVEPTEKNLDVFGHSIREVLIIAAMEVESHWKNTLASNGCTVSRPTTNEYVALKDIMKLGEYVIQFNEHPKLKPNRPFESWTLEKPTKSIPFFNAYNKVKHDRENCFQYASLRCAIDAVVACYVMTIAQFGYANVVRRSSILLQMFDVVKKPIWSAADCYMVSGDDWPAEEVQYWKRIE